MSPSDAPNSSADEPRSEDHVSDLQPKLEQSSLSASSELASKSETIDTKRVPKPSLGNFSSDLNRVRIVAIGASAGGLEALERTLAHIPSRLDVAFVVLQHLSPDHVSHLGELLGRKTTLPIETARANVVPKASHIYLIPRDAELEIVAGRFVVHKRDDASKRLRSIDRFMESLAADRGHHSVAVVLSGTGSDGTVGSRAIHAVDGLVISQIPDTAAFDGMPISVIQSGCVDLILAPESIGHTLAEYGASHLSASDFSIRMFLNEDQARVLVDLTESILRRHAVDLFRYRPSKIFQAAASILGPPNAFADGGELANSFDTDQQSTLLPMLDYSKLASSIRGELIDHDNNLKRLHDALLDSARKQIRDVDYLDFFRTKVIPPVIRQSRASSSIRCWIPAAGDPLEACVLAALFHMECKRVGCNPEIEILAKLRDGVDESATDWGAFDGEKLSILEPDVIENCFTRIDGKLSLKDVCREYVRWVDFEIFDEQPPVNLDVVIVRGLLSLLTAKSQRVAIAKLEKVVKQNGFVCLGPGETVSIASRNFIELDRHFRLYRKAFQHKEVSQLSTNYHFEPSSSPSPSDSASSLPLIGSTTAASSTSHSAATLIRAYDKALQFMNFPGFIVDEKLELIHSFGGGNHWLSMGGGEYSNLLPDMCPKVLGDMLPGAVSRALHLQEDVEFSDVKLPIIGSDQAVSPAAENDAVNESLFRLQVSPLSSRVKPLYALVILKPETSPSLTAEAAIEGSTGLLDPGIAAKRVHNLERELAQTKRHLKATVQALETSNEELQATNEELTASNEEMQSSNEELQSVNEQVISVNEEMHGKVAELRESNDDMDNLLRSAEIAVVYLDADLCVRRFTPRAASYFQFQQEDMGRPLDHFRNYLNHESVMEDCREVLSSELSADRELQDEHGNHILLRLLPYRQAGESCGVVLTVLEIGRAKVAESKADRMTAIIESSPDAVIGLSPAGTVETWNQGAVAIYGYSVDEAIGLPYEHLLFDDSFRFSEIDKLSATGKTDPIQMVHRRFDGSTFDASVSISRYEMIGQPDGLAVSVRDISSQVQAQKSVRDALVRRDQFLAFLSHELRNPLNAISAASQLLQKTTDSQSPVVKVIDRQIKHSVRLLDDLLDISRITSGKLKLQMEPVDLTIICRDAVDTMANRIEEKKQHLNLKIPHDPIMLTCDRERLLQSIDNLIGNAIKYTPIAGEIALSLEEKVVDLERFAVVSVRDNGVGITPNEQDSIFSLFAQGSDSNDGLGIGLALVKGIVESHGGKVTVESEGLGKGSLFSMSLPLVTAKSVTKKLGRDLGKAPHVEGSLRIVVVEDGDDNRILVTDILRLDGHTVESFATGRTGLKAILESKPDVALVDIGLPDISGLDIATGVRDRYGKHEVYLIAVTGLGLASDRTRIFEAGFDEHVVKPIDMNRVNSILSHRQVSQDGS